jgi:hypothetical protein
MSLSAAEAVSEDRRSSVERSRFFFVMDEDIAVRKTLNKSTFYGELA